MPEPGRPHASRVAREKTAPDWRGLARNLGSLLGLALVAQFGLAIFEGTFALYAQRKFAYGPLEVGTVFMVCGLVMTVFQVGAITLLAGRISEMYQISAGFGLMGLSLALLVLSRTRTSVFALVALLALGMAFVSPNLGAAISKRGGSRRAGAALGFQNAANSFGQATGPLFGGALFVWHMSAPYLLTGALLVAVALATGWKAMEAGQRRVRLA